MEPISNYSPISFGMVYSDTQVDINHTLVDSLMASAPDVNTGLVHELINKTLFPSENNELVSSKVTDSLELLSETNESFLKSLNADVTGLDAKTTMAKQKIVVTTTENTLETVRNSIRNDKLNVAASVTAFYAEVKTIPDDNERASAIDTGTSYAELWGRIAIAISSIKSDYVDFYADLMQKYTEMYQAFNEYLQKASSSSVSTGDDGNNVKFNTSTMQNGYDQFYKELVSLEASLGKVKGWDSMSDAEKESVLATLAPAFAVDSSKGGMIYFNIDQYNSVKNTMPSGISNGKVSTASYQAWLATFNAVGGAFQSNMQAFSQRYSQSNSTFDNLNKVLSGAISSLSDSANQVLKSLN